MFTRRGRLLLQFALLLWSVKAVSPRQHQLLRRVCYFTNWSCDLLVKEAYFCLRDLDVTLCSHVIYAFAGIDVASLSLSPIRVDDESVGNVKGRYVEFNDMKKNHAGLKTLLSAGGTHQAEKFKNATLTAHSRRQFAYNIADYVRKWGFDGLDLDWEYPGEFEKEALTQLVQELRSAFQVEARQTGKQELLLSVAAPVGEERVHLGYQVDLLSKEVDMINLMAYDFYYGAWDLTAFNSPLYSRHHHKFSKKYSVEWIVQLWIKLGAPPHKINLGIAGYGQSFTLLMNKPATVNAETLNSAATGNSIKTVHPWSTATDSPRLSTTQHPSSRNKNETKSPISNSSQHLSVNDSAHKNSNICDPNSIKCAREVHFSQNVIKIKNSRNMLVFDRLYDVDIFNETTHTKIGRLVKTNFRNKTDDTEFVTNRSDTKLVDDIDTIMYGFDNNKLGDTDTYGVRSNKIDGTDTYGVLSNKLDGTDTYGVLSNKLDGTDTYGVLSNKLDGTDTYGVLSNKKDYNGDPMNGVDSNKIDYNDTTMHGVDSNKQVYNDATAHGVDSNEQVYNDATTHGFDSKKQAHNEADMYGVDSSNQSLKDAHTYGVGSMATSPGRPGRLRHLKGQLSYPEICEMMQAGAATFWDQEQRVPYITLGDQWVGFDDARSIAEKVRWASEQRLGGVMFWSVDLDDFKGYYCYQGRYPLLSAMSDTVISIFNQENESMSEHVTDFTTLNPNSEETEIHVTTIHGLKVSRITNISDGDSLQTEKANSNTSYNQTTKHPLNMTTLWPQQIANPNFLTPEKKLHHNSTKLLALIGGRNLTHPTFQDGAHQINDGGVYPVIKDDARPNNEDGTHQINKDGAHLVNEHGATKPDFHNRNISSNISEEPRTNNSGDTTIKSGLSELVDLLPTNDQEEAQAINFYYYYIAFNAGSKQPALPTAGTMPTDATTTKTTTRKPRKTTRQHWSKRKHFYRNSTWTLASSISVIVCRIFMAVAGGLIILEQA